MYFDTLSLGSTLHKFYEQKKLVITHPNLNTIILKNVSQSAFYLYAKR
jgi:hypothetical protein